MDEHQKNLRNYPIRRFLGVISLGMGFLGILQIFSTICETVFVYFGVYARS